MLEITLQHPIHTLDNRELVPAGVTLTEDVIREVILANNRPIEKSMPLMSFGTVKNDIFQFFATPPYKTIFANHQDTEDILNIMDQVVQPIPVLESMDYFREYDFHTYRHMLMTFALSTLMAKILIPDFQRRIHNATAGPSHDQGKICVPLEILMKTDPLTQDERNILHQHPVAGYVLLCYYSKNMDNFSARVARDHHERRDGSGYLRGLKLRDPMVEIVAVADVYDALISPRPYRPVSYDNRTALEEVTSMAERGELSWDALMALIAVNRSDKPDFGGFKVSQERRGTPPQDNTYGMTADPET